MKEAVLRFIHDQGLLSPDDRVLVAISGGRDSVCLAHLLHTSGFHVALAHVNYGLRGKASDDDESFVKELGLRWHLKVYVKHAEPGSFDRDSLQEVARNIRYAFFDQLVSTNGYTAIATAHHRDDLVETLFLNLLRGTGIHGLRGIPQKRGNIVRPLLHCSREEIDRYVRDHGLAFRDDVSNESDKYVRNRIRHHLVPLLAEIDPAAMGKIGRSIENLGKDAQAVMQMAEGLLEKTEEGWLINLRLLPDASRATWSYHCLRNFGFNRQQAEDIVMAGTGKLITNETHTVVRQGDLLIVRENVSSPKPLIAEAPGVYRFGDKALHIIPQAGEPGKMPRNNREVWLDATRVTFPLTLRKWEPGDRMQPLGCSYEVKISDYLSDRKVDRLTKNHALVLCDAHQKVLWLVNHQVADFVKIDEATREIYSCTIS